MDKRKYHSGLLISVRTFRSWTLYLLLITLSPNVSSVSLIACDGETAKLSCSGSELINISEVYYGRNNQYNCRSFKSNPVLMTCQLQGALHTVRQKCGNRGQCSFVVGRQTFDDPCPNANKYLYIKYKCSPLHESCTGGIKSISSRVRYEQAKPAKVSAWMRDPLLQNPKIYQMAAVRFVSSNLWEYATPEKMRKGKADTFHHLPDTIAGTGFLVYDNHIYYNLEQTRKVVKISLYNQDKRVTAVLPHANYMNTSPYGDDTDFHYDTDIDLAVDEQGLWAIYATENNQGSIVVSKLDRHSLSVIRTYNTNYYKMSAINAFMTCGCLYVVNYTSLVIDYKFNTTSEHGEKVNIPIPELSNQTTSISYNPKDHKLYVWDNDAVLYDVEFQSLATTTLTSTTTRTQTSKSTLTSSTTTTTTKTSSDRNIHPSVSSTSPHKKPSVPSRQCPQRNISGLSWPATRHDTVAVLPCPGKCLLATTDHQIVEFGYLGAPSKGEVFWKCGGGLEDVYWMDLPDFKQCTSPWLISLKNSINRRNARSLCDELIEEVQRNRKIMSSWDIIEVIDTLFVILKNAESDLPSAATLTSNFVEISNVLLDEDLKTLWQQLDVSMRRETSERLVASLEQVAMLLFADVTTDNQRYDSKWSGPHVNLKLMVESAKSASKATWEVEKDATVTFEGARFGDLKDKDRIALVFIRLEDIGTFMEDNEGFGSKIYPVNSDVILVSAATVGSSVLKPQKVLLTSGKIKLKFSQQNNFDFNECAFWDLMSTDGQAYGKWSGNGCMTTSKTSNQITCECNHMTSFALLSSDKDFPNNWFNESLENRGKSKDEEDVSSANSKIEYLLIIRVGIIFAIVILAVVEILLSFYSMELDENTINKNMVLNVLITSVCFAGGINQMQFKALCGVVAVILHFGIISSATWSAISCLHLLIADEIVDQNRRWKRYYLIGYAIPTVTVIITSIANHQAYSQNEICWISSDEFTIYSVVIPLLAAVLSSVACIILVLKKLCYSTELNHQSIKRKMLRVSTQKICLVNALLAGLWASLIPWMCGTQQEVTAWLSCIFSVLYGVACFMIYFVFDEQVRGKVNELIHHLKKDDFSRTHTPHSNGRRHLVPPVGHRTSSGFPLVNHSLHSPQSCSEESRPLPPTGARAQTLNFTESQIGEQNCPLIGPSSAGSLPHDLTSCSASCCVCRSEGSDSKYYPHCSANSSNISWNSYVQHQRTSSSGPVPKPTQVHHCINCNSTECSLPRKYDRKGTSTSNHFYEQPRHVPFCQCSGAGSGCYDHLHEDMNQPRHGPVRRVRPGCHCRSVTTSSESTCPHPSHFYETLGSFRKSPQQPTDDSNGLELLRQVTNPIQYSSDAAQTPQDPRFRQQQQRAQYFDRASLSSSSAERQSNHSSSFDSRDSSQHLQRSSHQQRRPPGSFQHRCDPRTIRTLPEDSRLCDVDDLEDRTKNTFTCNGSCRHPRNGRSSDPLSTDQGYDTDSQMQNRREKTPPREDGSRRNELKRLIRPQILDSRKENGSSDSENDLEVENIIRSSHLPDESVGDDDVMLSSLPQDEEVIDTEHGGFISPTDTVTSWAALGPDPSYGKLSGPNCKSMHAILVKRQYKNAVASAVSKDQRRNSSYANNNETPCSYTLPGTSDSATKARIDLRTGGVNMVTNL